MKDMLKSKAIIGFLVIVVGFASIGGIDNTKKLEYEEFNNVVVINQ